MRRLARQRQIPEEQIERLEQAVRLALEIRASTDRRRRREAALTSLVDTAQDMAFHSNLESLLTIVTSHARRLLDVDMAYVSLRQPDGGSYVHQSDGETTALSVGLAMDRGLGLGEFVQERRAPFWTSDYLADQRFAHEPKIDEVVRSEGLHAIAAVPMTHGGKTIGALYGASRDIRHFSPNEISLLRSLAEAAAAAIRGARRMERLQADLAEARSENARTQTALAAMRGLSESQSQLADLVLEGGDADDVLRAAADVLGGTFTVRDSDGKILAATGAFPELDAAVVVRAVLDSHASGMPTPVTDTVWATHVTTGVAGPGVLLFQEETPLTEEGKRLLYATGQTVALLLLLRHSVATAAGPARDEYLDDLLASAPQSPRRLAERARRLGMNPGGQHVVLVVRPEGGKQGEAALWASSYAYRHGGLKTLRAECLVLLLPGTDASAAARAASDNLSPLLGHPVTVGAAGPTYELASVNKVYQEAQRCLDALVALGGTGGTAAARDLGFLGLLLSDDRDVDSFIASSVGPVLDYDAQRSTELISTLEAYFTSGGSPTRAAQDLHVHTNTVARRLDRITELLGDDWQQPTNALEIQLALRLLRARHAMYRTSGPQQDQAERGT
ncbi:helix-turn-helix domain-containing protein [Streptomyces sp. NPDC005728]|uniref:helix-turn-helix domain-containing protein n=1 Tax=Streptomyces sp. NPDC005728 TaxID=3157054 RepID=UPI0033E457AB